MWVQMALVVTADAFPSDKEDPLRLVESPVSSTLGLVSWSRESVHFLCSNPGGGGQFGFRRGS